MVQGPLNLLRSLFRGRQISSGRLPSGSLRTQVLQTAAAFLRPLPCNRQVVLQIQRPGQVRDQEGVLPRSVLYLSRGTADQLYLAVRLAVCRLTSFQPADLQLNLCHTRHTAQNLPLPLLAGE